MKKTNAQLEKRKREKEKRKKTEKAILRLAADIPNSPSPAVAASTKTEGVSIASRSSIHDDRAVKCLRGCSRIIDFPRNRATKDPETLEILWRTRNYSNCMEGEGGSPC